MGRVCNIRGHDKYEDILKIMLYFIFYNGNSYFSETKMEIRWSQKWAVCYVMQDGKIKVRNLCSSLRTHESLHCHVGGKPTAYLNILFKFGVLILFLDFLSCYHSLSISDALANWVVLNSVEENKISFETNL